MCSGRESEVLCYINFVDFLQTAADNEIGIERQVFLSFVKLIDREVFVSR